MSNIIDEIDKASMRDDIPEFRPGDSVKVHVKVVEGSRTRVQVLSVPSRCIPRSLTRSRLIATVRSVAPSCTTCAVCAARLPRSRRRAQLADVVLTVTGFRLCGAPFSCVL